MFQAKEFHHVLRSVLVLVVSVSIAFPSQGFSAPAQPSSDTAAQSQGRDNTSYEVPPTDEDIEKVLGIGKSYSDQIEAIEESLRGAGGPHSSGDVFSLLQQKSLGLGKYVPAKSVRVFLTVKRDSITERPETIEEIPVPKQGAVTCARKCQLELRDFRNHPLKEIMIDVEFLTRIGPFIVFTRKGSYNNASKTQTLSFIDLDRYEPLIGRESGLPVFEIPLGEKVQSLRTNGDHLEINGQPHLSGEDLESFSKLLDGYVNAQANLSDPSRLAGALILAENLAHYLEAFARNFSPGELSKAEGEENANVKKLLVKMPELQKELAAGLERIKQREVPKSTFLNGLKKRFLSGQKVVGLANDSLNKNSKHLSEEQLTELERFNANLRSTVNFDETIAATNRTMRAQRSISGAISKFQGYLFALNPDAPNVIKAALINAAIHMKSIVSNSKNPLIAGPRRVISPVAKWVGKQDLLAYAGMYGFLALGFFPEQAAGVYGAFAQSAEWLFRVLNPLTVIPAVDQAYIAGGMLTKTIIGFSGIGATLATLVGFYHVTQNVVRLVIDMRRPDYPGFVTRQSRIADLYYEGLSKREAERRDLPEGYSAEDDVRIKEYFRLLFEERFPRDARREAERRARIERQQKLEELRVFAEADAGGLDIVKKPIDLDSAHGRTLGWALRTFIFSYASYSQTALDYSAFWNSYSGLRYSTFEFFRANILGSQIPIFVKPKLDGAFVRLVYPRFFSTTVKSGETRLNLPTKLNGGTESIAQILGRWVNNAINVANPNVGWAKVKQRLKAVNEFEESVLDLEADVERQVTSAALRAFTRYSYSDEALSKLYSLTGVDSIASRTLAELSFRDRAFIFKYFDSVFSEVMRRLLQAKLGAALTAPGNEECLSNLCGQVSKRLSAELENLATQLRNEGEIPEASLDVLKELVVANFQSTQLADPKRMNLRFSDDEIRNVLVAVESDAAIFDSAKKAAEASLASASNLIRNGKFEFIGYLDPTHNASMRRYAVVERQRKDPQAMSRAVRQELTSIFATMPIDLFYTALLSAGITDGPLKPIQDEMFGPTAIMYASRMKFYNGIVTGTALGLLSNAWLTLQENEMMEKQGHYDHLPTKEDAKRSFFFYLVKMFMSKENSLTKAYRRNMEISWHNLPAAMPNISLLHLGALGRLDVSMTLMGYLLGFFTPYSAMLYKLEQAFELAAYYDAKDIPREWLVHPAAQAYLQKATQIRRIKFNLVRDLFLNPIGTFIGDAENLGTATGGSRAMLRSILGGTLPDEALINGAHHMADALKEVPGVNKIASGAAHLCDSLLGADNPEWTKVGTGHK